jgi:MarR family transcriptional regulator, lower aerobic nicotinate degradation pathway regulator
MADLLSGSPAHSILVPANCEAYFVFSYTNIRAIDSFKFMQGGTAPQVPGSDVMAGRRAPKTESSWPLEQRPGYLIRRLHQIHVALFQEKCAAFEITPLQYSLLTALAKRGTADQTTLAADIVLDRTTTTGALKRLQSRHFVDRAIEHRDRRSQTCRLTRAGTALLRKMEKSARTAHLETVADLSKADQKRFIAMMQKILAARSRHSDDDARSIRPRQAVERL